MTIAKTVGFSKNVAVGRADRGGNNMNLISEAFMKLNLNDRKERYKCEANRKIGEYGYEYFQSLEYGCKPLKNGDFVFGEYLLNRMIR